MVSPEALDRLAAVDDPDPHGLLGPHEEEGSIVVRAFRPDALAITVLPDEVLAPRPMRRIHDLGVFEARFPEVRAPFPYRLEIAYETGLFTLRDPYAFPPALGDLDLHLAAEGTHLELYRRLGAHVREMDGVRGTSFAVWAPNARRVSVTGDFNAWDGRLHAMRRMSAGIWELFLPDVGEGALYKFEVKTQEGLPALKSDPYGRAMELRPLTASKVVVRRFAFTDEAWMAARAAEESRRRPLSIYEVHLGSWRRVLLEPGVPRAEEVGANKTHRWLTYRELAAELVDYVAELGFTHLELMPVMEHPFDGSWGYQVSGYFAPTSRYGTPDDLRFFIDRCHARGLGVILDWTPAHFPKDAFALGRFDGTALYEHPDPRRGEHRQWHTYIFDYGRPEVKNFLLSNALYWLDEFHADGLRVDAVASMLYLDYSSNRPGEWVPNKFGGRENLEAVAFLRELCDRVHARFPGAILTAEESTTWPGVTRPTYVGGLGFDLKWNMGWMHDTLDYFKLDPIFRAFHHTKVTFGLMYAFSERFLLPLSHDEVVHLKKSLLSKMPGDRWKMLANLRALYGYMWAHPGKKLLFMGGELGQWAEWSHDAQLDWGLLQDPEHRGLWTLVRDLNAAYRRYPALFELDDEQAGFRWIDANDSIQSVASFVRFPRAPAPASAPALPVAAEPAQAAARSPGGTPSVPPEAHPPTLPPPPPPLPAKGFHVVFAGNFTPIPRFGYRLGVPRRCRYVEVINTDAAIYGGSGMGNLGKVEIEAIPSHGFAQSISITLPPLSSLWLAPELDEDPPASP
jgi:1,4-alpha-glucan branching enzyme